MDSLPNPIRTYNSMAIVVSALREKGNVKQDASREFMQTRVEHLLKAAGILIADPDPWYKLTILARKVVERIAIWAAFFRESPVAVPHDLLPFELAAQTQNLNLRQREQGQPDFQAPPGLHMAGKIANIFGHATTTTTPLSHPNKGFHNFYGPITIFFITHDEFCKRKILFTNTRLSYSN